MSEVAVGVYTQLGTTRALCREVRVEHSRRKLLTDGSTFITDGLPFDYETGGWIFGWLCIHEISLQISGLSWDHASALYSNGGYLSLSLEMPTGLSMEVVVRPVDLDFDSSEGGVVLSLEGRTEKVEYLKRESA